MESIFVEINKDKILSNLKVDKKHREWYETVAEVASFMNNPALIGKWLKRLKGIPHETLKRWMRDAEKNQSKDFSSQKLFNSYKKKYRET